MSRGKLAPAIAATAALLAAGPAAAHTAAGPVSGLTTGFVHPIGGLDHVLAMIAVGVLAVQLGGRALWSVPLAFVAMMIVGGMLGMASAAVPFVEYGIAGSVVLLGAVIAFGRRLPIGLATGLAGLFAVFHGHAHGTEMAAGASAVEYAIGFLAATILLHVAGIALGVAARRMTADVTGLAVRAGGGAIATAGIALVVS
jgi:urease accessory protein